MSTLARPRSPLFDLGFRLLGQPRLDPTLCVTLAAIMFMGLGVLYSASGGDIGTVIRQLVRVGAGVAALVLMAGMAPKTWRLWTPWVFLASLALVTLVLFIGEGRGVKRWLDLGIVRFQPSELMKLTVPMMLAWFFHSRPLPPRIHQLLAAFVMIGVPAVLIALEPDLGTALLVAASGLFVIFMAGISWKYITVIVAAMVAAAPVLWANMRDYQRSRILTLLDPDADPLGQGWNIIQSKIAVGSGGLYGKGWTNGTQAQLDFLPERSTDFIFAVLAEEFGLFGVLTLLVLYLVLIGRGLQIATLGKDTYSRLLAGSLSLTFFVYVAVNAGMITGMMPVVGVPLPLVSYGGTSIVTLLAAFGMLMSINGHRRMIRP